MEVVVVWKRVWALVAVAIIVVSVFNPVVFVYADGVPDGGVGGGIGLLIVSPSSMDDTLSNGSSINIRGLAFNVKTGSPPATPTPTPSPLPMPSPLPPLQYVGIVFEGWELLENGSYLAHWGWKNDNDFTVDLAGSYFTPDISTPAFNLTPGRQRDKFQTVFDGNNLVWTARLPDGKTKTSTASRNGPTYVPPTPTPTPTVTPTPVPTEPSVTIDHNGNVYTVPVFEDRFSAPVSLTGSDTIVISMVDANDTAYSMRLVLDGDRLNESVELAYGFDPLDSDSDCSLTPENEADNGIIDGYERLDGELSAFAKVRIGANLLVNDTDSDGLTDYFEMMKMGLLTDVRSSDTDGDGIPDAGEDPDEDGLTNLQEQSLGTDPKKMTLTETV
jgi:hypothetical protein